MIAWRIKESDDDDDGYSSEKKSRPYTVNGTICFADDDDGDDGNGDDDGDDGEDGNGDDDVNDDDNGHGSEKESRSDTADRWCSLDTSYDGRWNLTMMDL